MAYSIFTPTGSQFATTPISVADNTIDTSLYDTGTKSGIQLVGRNALNYGTAVAQNTVQMVSNFASSELAAPGGTVALQGQLWFNVDDGNMYAKTGIGGNFPANWSRLIAVPADGSSGSSGSIGFVNSGTTLPATGNDGDIFIITSPSTQIHMWANGAWRQLFPAIYS
jgi:hypothetical protein